MGGGLSQSRTWHLADDFFLMVHDDLSGRPRLPERILGVGLASALLGELVLLDAIDIVKGDVVLVTDEPPSPTDEPRSSLLASVLFRELKAERHLPVQDWLNYLGRRAPERVARRLETKRLVYLKQPRIKVPGRSGRWAPTDITTAGWPAIDVKLKVYNGKADVHTLMLFGLTRATGLEHPSLWEIRERLKDPAALNETLEPLVVFNSPLLDLLAHTEAVVGSAVTSQRIS